MAEDKKLKKILLIEDDVFMVELLAHEFGQEEFELVIAKTGSEGVEKFKSEKPDLILLDILLPDFNGFEALRQIRREPGGPETKVVVLSNIGEANDIEEAKRLGSDDYLIKANASLPEIVERARAVLEKWI